MAVKSMYTVWCESIVITVLSHRNGNIHHRHHCDVIMGVPNHQPNDCLLDHLFGGRSKKTLNIRFTGLCVGNSPVTGEFPAQMASNVENVSIWWRHHGKHSYLYGNVQYNEISYTYENVYYERKVLFISVYSSWRTVSTIRWGWLNMPKSLGMSIRRTEKNAVVMGMPMSLDHLSCTMEIHTL